MIVLIIAFTIGGRDFERRERMPTAEACFSRAAEELASEAHSDVDQITVGCMFDNGNAWLKI